MVPDDIMNDITKVLMVVLYSIFASGYSEGSLRNNPLISLRLNATNEV